MPEAGGAALEAAGAAQQNDGGASPEAGGPAQESDGGVRAQQGGQDATVQGISQGKASGKDEAKYRRPARVMYVAETLMMSLHASAFACVCCSQAWLKVTPAIAMI